MNILNDVLRGLLGIAALLALSYLFSRQRSAINWRLVGIGIGLQLFLAFAILVVPGVSQLFDALAKAFRGVLDLAAEGAAFIFGGLVKDTTAFGFIFAFQVLPTIIFFSALTSILYYFGILQRVIYGMAWVFTRLMGLTGSESLAAAANIFIGQTEAPLTVKPYLEKMSRSEIMCLMTGGMATIAGSVFAAYVGFLGGEDPEMQQLFAKHLLTASIISAPAAIVAAKILVPEDKAVSPDKEMSIHLDAGSNLLDAISRGTSDGLRLAVNVGVMLMVFTSLVYMVNLVFLQGGALLGINDWVRESTGGRFEGFSFTYVLGLVFAPLAWLIGTPAQDVLLIGQLLGQKTVINEFYAYGQLDAGLRASLSPKSLLIATYALCGFSNFASIGIQIGGISALAPGQRRTLSELGMLSLVGGTIACLMTACIAGMLSFTF